MVNEVAPRVRGWRNQAIVVVALVAGLCAGWAQAALTEVYRFYHLDAGRHFYTASSSEKQKVLDLYPRFVYEGVAFFAETSQVAGTVPVYRFYHQVNGSHVYTASESEKNSILTNYPVYYYEGIQFYAEQSAAMGAVPLYRLYNTKLGNHFFTTDASEAAHAVATWPWFVHEGAVFYVRSSGGTTPPVVPPTNPPVNGNAPPTISLTAASTSINTGQATLLTATAADSDGTVAKVAFYSFGAMLGEVMAAPYTYSFTANSPGVYSLYAVATDDKGATTTSNAVPVTVGGAVVVPGNVPPTVSLSLSTTSVATGSSVTLTASAADSDGTIADVTFFSNANQLAQDTTAPYSFVYSPNTAGTFSITAVATDNKGAKTTSVPVSLTVTGVAASTAPRISLSLSNSVVAAPSTVTLTAAATAVAAGATVAKVSFFVNGVNVLDDAVSPYTYTANVNAPGTYVVYATVTDSLGQVTSTLTQNIVAPTAPAIASTDPDVWRLLNQATFGASQAEAARVVSLGIPGWINDQLTKPISGYPDAKYNRIQLTTTPDCTTQIPGGGNYPGDSPQAMCARDHLSLAMIQRDFFLNAVNGSDQLRQRVAWALSQILVTSANEQDLSYAHVMSRYQNLMFQEAFGNFETLLQKVTYSPAMGNYLDMVNNDRPAGTRVPNENYAREIMQLFTIGLEELKIDGTPLLDAQNKPIPTYGQTEIAEFARVFTGYTYGNAAGTPATGKRGVYYAAPMVTYPATATTGHDPNAKTLLNGQVLPAGQTAQQDVDAAVRNVFMHPNTGPFISKQLIQRLVTGDPTPAYVARIAAVFNNNGAGVRGDLAAVVKAILLDSEARGGVKTAANYGSLKEPVLMVTGLIRALSGVTDGSRLEGLAGNLGQRPYYSPTVFNYFPPDNTIAGTSVLGPEFAIHTTNSAVARGNLVYSMVYGGFAPDATIPDSPGTRLFIAQFEPLADTPAAMVSQINKVLAGGQFPTALEATIVTAVNAVTISTPPTAQQRTDRARMAVYLMGSSYDYQVQR
jgi:uncharacterized protein (DUF1800 family)